MQNSVKSVPSYFKNLDGLRFIAALFVIIGHAQSMVQDRLGINPYIGFADKLATFGVDFFFVLSGFLISFLMYAELAETGTIHIRKFYIRRILRLWPLYYLFGFASILTASPYIHFFDLLDRPQRWDELWENLGYLTIFSTNWQTLFGLNYPASFTISHFWSLSVEEQFYLIWAPLMFLFRKRIEILLFLMIAIGVITTVWEPAIYEKWFYSNAKHTTYMATYSRFIFFGAGATLAYLVHKQEVITSYLKVNGNFSKYLQLVFSVFTLYMTYHILFGHIYYTAMQDRFINVFLSVGIILMAITRYTVLNLEFNFLKYLGKISFGIYVFHLLSLHLIWYFLDKQKIVGNTMYVLLPTLSTVLAVLLAAFSYQFIELWFLKQKHKFKFN